jgi:hypothetical protein
LNKTAESNEPIPLRWYDPISRQSFAAGVAFYNGSFGDYTLKINVCRGKFYLRPTSFQDQQTRYRVEKLEKYNGSVTKEIVGHGVMDESTKGKIHVKLAAYSDVLILG